MTAQELIKALKKLPPHNEVAFALEFETDQGEYKAEFEVECIVVSSNTIHINIKEQK